MQVAWTVVGIGLRLAQDLGAHRRRTYVGRPTLMKEMMRRAFWYVADSLYPLRVLTGHRTMILVNRRLSVLLGRSCAIQEEDFDTDLPLDIDDKHLHDQISPKQDVQSHSRHVSRVTHFIYLLKLNQIMGYTLRTIVRRVSCIRADRSDHGDSTPSTNPEYSWDSQDLIGSNTSYPNSTLRSINGRILYRINVRMRN